MARAGCLFEGVVVTNVGCPFACGASPDIGWVGSSCYCCCPIKPSETRLPIGILQGVVQLLTLCEAAGRWPAVVQLVIVVLLPKPDGGFRPIGLIPALPRLWMRARRTVAKNWEASQPRPYLFAGARKGATVAAWKQAARAEHAAALAVAYARSLLDLVKAFERIPHALLVRESVALGYPMWLIRLAVAT